MDRIKEILFGYSKPQISQVLLIAVEKCSYII